MGNEPTTWDNGVFAFCAHLMLVKQWKTTRSIRILFSTNFLYTTHNMHSSKDTLNSWIHTIEYAALEVPTLMEYFYDGSESHWGYKHARSFHWHMFYNEWHSCLGFSFFFLKVSTCGFIRMKHAWRPCLHEDSVIIPQSSDPHGMSQPNQRELPTYKVHLWIVQQYCKLDPQVVCIVKLVHLNKLPRCMSVKMYSILVTIVWKIKRSSSWLATA